MTTKVRTQVQLEQRQYEQLKRLAYERKQSLSAVVRRLLDEALGHIARQASQVREARRGIVAAGHDAEGRRDVARHHDDYVTERRSPPREPLSRKAVAAARRFRATRLAGVEFTVSSADLIRQARGGRSR